MVQGLSASETDAGFATDQTSDDEDAFLAAPPQTGRLNHHSCRGCEVNVIKWVELDREGDNMEGKGCWSVRSR